MQGTKTEVLKWLIDAPEKDVKGLDRLYEIKEWHPKRSLTANAYYHVLKAELASALRTTPEEIHEELLRRYSVVDTDLPPITLKHGIPISRLPGHWMLYKENSKWSSYLRLKGSSEMDTKEFSRLLDGLIDECKSTGIDTMTPTELAKLRNYLPMEARDA